MERDPRRDESNPVPAQAGADDERDPTTAPAAPRGEMLPDGQPVGPDNIRDGTVRGVMGGPNQSQGEGQGG